MLQAVIFDFDGVICDSEFLHYKALNAVFNRHGIDIPKDVHWDKYLGYNDVDNIRDGCYNRSPGFQLGFFYERTSCKYNNAQI